MKKFQWMIIRNERQFRALTGVPQKVFDTLLPEFTQCLESARQQNYQNHRARRKRRPGGGRKGTLSTPELKLNAHYSLANSDPYMRINKISILLSKSYEGTLKVFNLVEENNHESRVDV